MVTNFIIPSWQSLHEDDKRAFTYPIRRIVPGGIYSLEEKQIIPTTPAGLCRPAKEIPLLTRVPTNSRYEGKIPSLGTSPGRS
jgi:hypothetical protein